MKGSPLTAERIDNSRFDIGLAKERPHASNDKPRESRGGRSRGGRSSKDVQHPPVRDWQWPSTGSVQEIEEVETGRERGASLAHCPGSSVLAAKKSPAA